MSVTGSRPAAASVARGWNVVARVVLLALGAVCATGDLAAAQPAATQRVTFPATPPAGIFHVDGAGLLREAESAEINRIAGALLAEHDVPLLVVTLPSLAARGAAGYTIERYAAALFDEWGIGSQARNLGMLLLVSAGDRAARIELGAGYAGRYDAVAAHIMNELILPEFRRGNFAEGILAGVRGLDAMGRGLPLPASPLPWYVLPIVFGVIVATTAASFSLYSSGRKGWAWALMAALFALLLLLLRNIGRSSSRLGGGGSSGGGAFRGGSSGGGGATGRW